MIKIILSTFIGTIAYFLIGWIVFEGLLGKYMLANTTSIAAFRKDEASSSFLMLLVSCGAYALLLSLILGHWKPTYSFQEGAVIGAIVGILVAIMTNSYWYASTHFFNSLLPVAVDVLAAGLTVGFMGGVIAWFLGFWNK